MKAVAVVAPEPGKEEGFQAPGLDLFEFPPLYEGAPPWLSKPVLLAALAVVIVIGFFFAAFRSPRLVPRGIQNVGELGYLFVRDQIARPMMGKDGDRWMPLLVSLFFFIWIMNLMSVIPVAQFPVTSHIAFPAALAIFVWGLMVFLGMRHQGVVGYFKNIAFPPGLPWPIYFLLAPIELVSTLVLRPFTHAVRLFANMFAGHILVALFSVVGFYFLVENLSPLGALVGIVGVLVTIIMTAFEMFIQALQAFIFALLAASYIGGALHAEH